MSWEFSFSNDPQELQRRIFFLQSALSQRGRSGGFRPKFVPGRILLQDDVRSEAPFIFKGVAKAGEHTCTSNQWGAISVVADDGKEIGVRPNECVVLEMVENAKWRES